MKKHKSFLRVIKSYSQFEKVVSLILIAVIVIFGGKILFDKSYHSGGSPGREGVYTEGFQTNMLRINPVYADLNEADRDISKLIFTGLTKYNPENKNIVSDLAEVMINEDYLVYTFTLKNNIKFHDGELVDADDIIFTYKTVIQDPEFQNPILKANFEGVEIEKVDDRTVTFTLTAPNSFFINNTTVGLLPEHILKEVPIADLMINEFNFNPIGTGPYKVSQPLSTSLQGVTQIVLERFNEFYDQLPQLQQLRFFGYPIKSELIANKGTLNGIPKVTEEAIAELSDDSRFSMYGYSLPQYVAVFINMDNSNLKSLKVRQALQKAIYKDTFLDILPNTMRVETPVLSLDQDDYRYEANLDESKELLYDAGFIKFDPTEETENKEPPTEEEEIASVEVEEKLPEDEADLDDTPEVTDTEITEEIVVEETAPERIMRKNAAGDILEFRLVARLYPEGSYRYNEMNIILNYLEENWGKVGVKLNIELYDAVTLQEKIADRDYDLLVFGQNLGYNLDLYGYWHSTQTGDKGVNLSNYKSFAVDTLIEAIRNSFDDDEKEAKLKRLAEIIQEDIPAIFLYRPLYYYASDNKVKGITMENLAFPGDRFCSINEWTF